jgi:CBS domain-containing protein
MKVAEVMSRGVEPVAASASVQEAAIQMAEYDVGAVLIGTKEALEGILTDRDIILRLVVDGRNPAEVPARDVMSSTLFTCREDETLEAVFAQMRERQIRRMPVLDGAGKPVGIVTLSDLAKHVAAEETAGGALREASEPHRRRKARADDGSGPEAEKQAENAASRSA